ncbi:hypothetical protein BABINDRAFT_159615 [Babjeviella inositovora NRRL Y-12698]|uniref:Importin N-terminal domain-containing protein n=1 Tax=Babjeviella inositovora NRRL Y-12698 TaxID=984486 RepID=A0A1E3QZR9_9ASCO|nr:uncharacterized protein BABINDRAFT_159615 [Babjeviella inositovora NRRL Y-12698]ODQ83173.1 hypothetical protein BABINDRAFT_159615 [Babjeviella inositovora NRRL Y-12698]
MDQQYLSSLEETLKLITVPDSAVIKAASAKLSSEFYNNDLALPTMVHILQNHQDAQIRQLAAVEARKLVISKWATANAGMKTQIRDSILKSTFVEPKKLVRHQSARVVATIADIDVPENQWPLLMEGLVGAATSEDVQSKEMGLYILLTLLETSGAILIEHVNVFLGLFSQTLVDPSSKDARVTSLLALDVIASFADEMDEIPASMSATFKTAIPHMVNVLKDVVSQDDSDSAKQIFNVFNNLLLADSKIVGDSLVMLVQFMLEISLNTQVDVDYRVMALQFLISCVGYRKGKLSSKKLGPELMLAALKIASEEIDVDEELNTEDQENENEESDPVTLALRFMANLATELPVSQTITPLFENLNAFLSSSNQFEKRAALLALGVTSSGAPDYYSTQLPKLIPVIVSGLKDNSLVVRVAALRCLGQMTSELQDVIAEYHAELLPLIIAIIDSATNVNVYKSATYALDALIEFMNHEVMGQYMEPLMNKLFHMLQSAQSATLKSAIVSAIGSTAYASGKIFTPYFAQSIQFLEPFIANAGNTEGLSEPEIELRACTFENISTMARAVGSEPFAPYATPLLEAAHLSVNSSNSRIRESGFAFIHNMAKVYGKEFAPFLESIIPKIFECLQQDEFQFNPEDLENEELDEADLAEKFTVHTGITIEKEIASIALSELAMGCGNDFGTYVEPSLTILMDQVENSYGMREAALNACWKIVDAMLAANTTPKSFPIGAPQGSYVSESLLAIIKPVRALSMATLDAEFEIGMVATILDNITDLLKKYGAIIVTDNGDSEELQQLCECLMMLLKKEHPCQVEDEDMPEDEEDASETEAMMVETALEVLVSFSKTLGNDFNQIFPPFKEIIFAQVTASTKNLRVSACGALADIAAGLKDYNQDVEAMMNAFVDRLTHDKSIDVKGNASYGVGLIIESTSQDVSAAYPHILQLLSKLLSKADKKADSDNEETRDVVNRAFANASGCVARMALKHQAAVPLTHILPALFSHLPLETAFEENSPIFRLIMSLYEQNSLDITPFTPQVVALFAEVFKKENARIKLVSEATLGREEGVERLNQFASPEEKVKVIELLKYLDGKFAGVVSQNETLKAVI